MQGLIEILSLDWIFTRMRVRGMGLKYMHKSSRVKRFTSKVL